MREIMTTKLRVSGFLLCVAFVTATSCGGLKVRAISATTSGQGAGRRRSARGPEESFHRAVRRQSSFLESGESDIALDRD